MRKILILSLLLTLNSISPVLAQNLLPTIDYNTLQTKNIKTDLSSWQSAVGSIDESLHYTPMELEEASKKLIALQEELGIDSVAIITNAIVVGVFNLSDEIKSKIYSVANIKNILFEEHPTVDDKIYTTEELNNAKNRLLTQMDLLKATFVEVDLAKNSVNIYIPNSKKDDYSDVWATRVAEIEHVNRVYYNDGDEDCLNINSSWADYYYCFPSEINDDYYRQLKIDAGNILNNKKQLGIDGVYVNKTGIIVTVLDMTDKKIEAIKKMAGNSADVVNCVPKTIKTTTALFQKYYIRENENYILHRGLPIEIKNKPYYENGNIMLPIIDIYEVLNTSSSYDYTANWNKENNILELKISSLGHLTILISLENNTITLQDMKYNNQINLIGKTKIDNGTVYLPYLPYSPGNESCSFLNFPSEHWDEKTKTLTFCTLSYF